MPVRRNRVRKSARGPESIPSAPRRSLFSAARRRAATGAAHGLPEDIDKKKTIRDQQDIDVDQQEYSIVFFCRDDGDLAEMRHREAF